MADDMNGDAAAARSYSDGFQAAMGERVTNLGRRVSDMEVEMRTGFSQVAKSIEHLSTSLNERSRPQWQALSVALVFAGMIGALAYWPIRESTNDLKGAVKTIAESMVTREELDWRASRGTEERARTDAAIADLRSGTVTRNEWMERNTSRDHDIENIRDSQSAAITNLQRQVDLLRTDFMAFTSSLGNGRDSFQDMKAEIRRLEDRLDAMRRGRLPTVP